MRLMDLTMFVLLFKVFEYYCFKSRSLPFLESLDKLLCQIFSEPKRHPGREVIEAMTLYNWSLASMRECVLKQDMNVAKAARDLRIQGGPLFLKDTLNKSTLKLLKIDFKWSEHDIQKFLLLRSDISKNWKAFYKTYRKSDSVYRYYLNDSRPIKNTL